MYYCNILREVSLSSESNKNDRRHSIPYLVKFTKKKKYLTSSSVREH